jgi:hypothetical protein
MDQALDHGVGWRQDITPFLENMGVVVLDPCDKPIDIGLEGIEDRTRRRHLKDIGDYDTLAKEIKLLRVVDLRMVDTSDVLIVNIDTEIHACGTYEESFWANRLKNPTLIHCEQGKAGCPDWLFGTFPHSHIFNDWLELKQYMWHIHSAPPEQVDAMRRWMFFDYTRMMPKVSIEQAANFVPDWECA